MVWIMCPGAAFLYGGSLRASYVLHTLMLCFCAAVVVVVQWVIFGYSITFAPDGTLPFGNFDWAFLQIVNCDPNGPYPKNIPQIVHALFQMMFALVTPTLIVGSIANRIRLFPWIVFVIVWTSLAYDPIARMLWGLTSRESISTVGWLRQNGSLDWAGGLVVHVNAGVAALVTAFMVKPSTRPAFPHNNMLITVLGVTLLWFGWMGFNSGSSLAANATAGMALLNTNIAAATGFLTALIMERFIPFLRYTSDEDGGNDDKKKEERRKT